MMMDDLIKRFVDRSVGKIVERHIDAAIDRAIANSPVVQFIKTMQTQMLACDPNMDPKEAWDVAGRTLRYFLNDEGIKFGDPQYDWSRSAAVDLIHENEMHYWESV